MKKAMFVINSALDVTQLSVFNFDERKQQLIETFNSVNKKYPDLTADMLLLDMSPSASVVPHLEEFTAQFPNLNIAYLGQVPHVKAYSMAGQRSLAELTAFKTFFEHSESMSGTKDWGRKYDWVYKLSGRYQLSHEFHPSRMLFPTNSFVFAKPEKSWLDPQKIELTGCTFLHKLRLWGCHAPYFRLYINSIDYMMDKIRRYNIDIEHAMTSALYEHFPGAFKRNASIQRDYLYHDWIEYANMIGVCGYIAPSGEHVYE